MADIEKEVAENAPATDSSAQRTELHKTIWKIANDLRGSVDGWDFKSYVLNMPVSYTHLTLPTNREV